MAACFPRKLQPKMKKEPKMKKRRHLGMDVGHGPSQSQKWVQSSMEPRING
jgi:hypothetical protein